jgi:hypothetical protein
MLPTISAIAQAFASHFKCDYFAGLWGCFLVHDLMWESYPTSLPQVAKSGSPSWSWAAIIGKVCHPGGNHEYARAEILECSTTLVSSEAPFGTVTGGELVIQGHLKEVRLHAGRGEILDDKGSVIPDTTFRSDGDYGDWETSHGYGACIQVWCLVLGDSYWRTNIDDYYRGGGYHPSKVSKECRAMVLIKSPLWSNCYRRIGFLRAGVDYPPYWWEECEKVTVTIV